MPRRNAGLDAAVTVTLSNTFSSTSIFILPRSLSSMAIIELMSPPFSGRFKSKDTFCSKGLKPTTVTFNFKAPITGTFSNLKSPLARVSIPATTTSALFWVAESNLF